jgi:fructose-bisphosphate aldolase class I
MTAITRLESTARALVAPGKGILAADESFPTIAKRLQGVGVESSEEVRRTYRQMLLTAPGSEEFISGAILFDETLRQKTDDGTPIPAAMKKMGIIPGIKVDTGAKPLAGTEDEKVTEGLDGLRARLEEYRGLGAGFAKWRAVIAIGHKIPSRYCIEANAHALARYAALCQEQGIVPIVEPEVLMDGTHDIERCYRVTRDTLRAVFSQLGLQRVELSGMLLKPNMVISGKDCEQQAGVEEVAARTVKCLMETVPAAVPGIVFLSGGQSDELATAHLNAMNSGEPALPWELSFSYGRALQQPALKAWGGKAENIESGRKAFMHRARCNGAARYGRYDAKLEAGAA